MKKHAADPEAVLKNLRKLPGNKVCPNCGTQSEFGFGNVCIKFSSFVCDMCKTSHQAISHRVKSVTMSTWTLDEVNALTDEQGGGNDACRHTWLANAPNVGTRYPGGCRPKAGDRIEIFKQFVVDCYESGKFKSEDPYTPTQSSPKSHSGASSPISLSASAHTPMHSQTPPASRASSGLNSPTPLNSHKPVSVQSQPSIAPKPPKVAASPAPAPAVQDLLGFDEPCAPQAPSPALTGTFSLSQPVATNGFADFDEFSSSRGSTPAATFSFDAFGQSNAAASTSSSVLTSNLFSSPTPPPPPALAPSPAPSGPVPATVDTFDVFGSSASLLQPTNAQSTASGFNFLGNSNASSSSIATNSITTGMNGLKLSTPSTGLNGGGGGGFSISAMGPPMGAPYAQGGYNQRSQQQQQQQFRNSPAMGAGSGASMGMGNGMGSGMGMGGMGGMGTMGAMGAQQRNLGIGMMNTYVASGSNSGAGGGWQQQQQQKQQNDSFSFVGAAIKEAQQQR